MDTGVSSAGRRFSARAREIEEPLRSPLVVLAGSWSVWPLRTLN